MTAPDVTALHPPVDSASIASGTEIERQITGAADRNHGERYVDLDKILAAAIFWSPPHTIVSYNPASPNHFITEYHTPAHTFSCLFQEVGGAHGLWCIVGEQPERGWWKFQHAIAKL
ncbi:hypothetical protein B0H14DRAFT_2649552 [Mycena olivaceomarginata]|nr:hypothetical protein B0H14DRAFT_2649552 [Mycena olivaceomarginata]